ncbi:MAG: general secretion pathway protein J [Oceanicoccus sp.]|jgi:general secretion pathway protein J
MSSISLKNEPKYLSGFTLIEVMLAMVITAFIALLAYSGLNVAMTAATQHEKQARQLGDIQLPLTIIERDVRHAVARPIVDGYNEILPAFKGDTVSDHVLMLTRRAWDNPRGLPRGDIQRVRYSLENDELWRESWSVLDRTSDEEGMHRTRLLTGVVNLELNFLDGGSVDGSQSPLGGTWIGSWEKKTELPLALELKLALKNFGEVTRVFSITTP